MHSSRPTDTRVIKQLLVTFLKILSRTILALLITISLIESLPLQPWRASWYLRIGQIATNYSPTLLFALFIEVQAKYFTFRGPTTSKKDYFAHRITLFSLIIYSILVPVQFLSGGLQWSQTVQLSKQAIFEAESQASALIKSINSAKSDAELQAVLGTPGLPSQPSFKLLTLEQKDKIIKTINDRIFEIRSRGKNELQKQLATLGISTTKGVLVAGIMAFSLSKLKKLVIKL